MNQKMCEKCLKKPAKRVSYIYLLPNSNIGIFSRFKRKNFKNLSAIKKYICDECYFENTYGLYTIKCKCNKEFKISVEEYFNLDKNLTCPFCNKNIKLGDI